MSNNVKPLFSDRPCAGQPVDRDQVVADLEELLGQMKSGEAAATRAMVIWCSPDMRVTFVTCGKATHHEQIADLAIAADLAMNDLYNSR